MPSATGRVRTASPPRRCGPASQALEPPDALPVGDGGVEGLELDPGVVEVVVDDLLPERLTGDGGAGKRVARIAERARDVALVRRVGVALEGGLELQLVVDPV